MKDWANLWTVQACPYHRLPENAASKGAPAQCASDRDVYYYESARHAENCDEIFPSEGFLTNEGTAIPSPTDQGFEGRPAEGSNSRPRLTESGATQACS